MNSTLKTAVRYLREHPEEVVRAARGVAALRVGLPLDVLRWLVGRSNGKSGPRDVELEAVPPGLRLSATVDLMGNEVRASATVLVDRVRCGPEELRVEVRLRDVSLKLLREAPDSPVATLIKSGALDLSKPGNLAAYMPKRPEMLVEAEGDRIVVDLVRHPRLAQSESLRRALAVITPMVGVREIETDERHLDVALAAFPRGLRRAWDGWRNSSRPSL